MPDRLSHAKCRDAREHPILFSAPMILAILNGSKTQTRRIVKGDKAEHFDRVVGEEIVRRHPDQQGVARWSIGDHLWVRETIIADWAPNLLTGEPTKVVGAFYGADHEEVVEKHGFGLCPWWDMKKDRTTLASIHMPRHASRITLEVVRVRMQRLQWITEDDAIAEGAKPANSGVDTDGGPIKSHRTGFVYLWNSIHAANGPDGWCANPWVTATTFRRIEIEP